MVHACAAMFAAPTHAHGGRVGMAPKCENNQVTDH